jgi:hypothetical protein
MKKLLSISALSVVFFALSTAATFAFDGQINLTNRIGEDGRCWASTVLMQNQNYKVLVSCRDITYPGGNQVFYYVMWANPAAGGNPIRLGDLGMGKNEFQIQQEFTSLFVTTEKSTNLNTPTGQIVMQGTVQPIDILQERGKETATTPAQTPNPISGDNLVTATPITTPQPRTGIAKFLTSGILAVLALGGLIFVIFLVTKR